MELIQRINIPIPPTDVWAALNNPEILKDCIPGCEAFVASGEDMYDIVVQAKVGPVKARFTGEVALADMDPPHAYTLNGSGKGGVAGFAKGGAHIRLVAIDDGTLMTYQVKAAVGGKLAQLGARLVMGAARKMADDFFTRFVRTLSNDPDLVITLETVEEGEQ